MQKSEIVTAELEKNDSESILKWIDSLAKIVVVITALLYIVGRSYTESYYAHMGVPTSSLPLSIQEYLFMSTKSLSFLKSAASASFISIITGLLFNTVMQSAHSLWETLLERFNPKLKKEDKADSIEPKKRGKKTKNANTDKEIPEIEADPQKPANDKEVIFGFQNKMKGWLRGRLIYIIPTFIVLVFAMLIPSARASGKVDSENAIQNAPLGRVLLNQPSIPELSPQISTTQNNDLLYDYGMLPVIGTLGDNYLLVLDRPNGKKNILSVPVAQIVSINYVNFVSLTAVPTITATPVKVSSSTPTPP